MAPLVSIILNNYNYGHFLAASIDSALAQTYAPIEVIVVDDGSTDNSRHILAGYGDRIRLVLKANGGQSSAFNAGFAVSNGDYIAFLDSDDLFTPNKVARMMEIASANDVGWLFHHLQWTDAELNPLETPGNGYSTGVYDFRQAFVGGRCNFAGPATSGLIFTRSLMERMLPAPEALQISTDNYLKYSALALAPGYYTTEQLALQRIHSSNAYTGVRNATLRADVQLATAYGLRAKQPQLRPVCNRMYADGIARKLVAGHSPAKLIRESGHYFGGLPASEKAVLAARIMVKTVRMRTAR